MAQNSEKWVYYFDEGRAAQKTLLGGKGANLCEMTRLGLPIPSGFVISTRACIAFQADKAWPVDLDKQVAHHIARLEKTTGKTLGDPSNPLLVSVRSGAAISMPGMMDTVLNLGLNDTICEALATQTGNERFALDSYRRFIQMFGDVVMGLQRIEFEHVLDALKKEVGASHDTDLTAAHLRILIKRYFQLWKTKLGSAFPMDPHEQLHLAISAVFASWDNPRAVAYRNMERIPHTLGTAVNVQAMVFGNTGPDSATGVAFTRNPSTGENARYGEYLPNAQGEDVVAGIRTPHTLQDMRKEFPRCAKQLYDIFALLEDHYRDMQDIEFTIEKNKLYILQTRTGKRTAAAAVRCAVEFCNEGRISKREAVMRVRPNHLETLLHKQLDPKAKKSNTPVLKGLPASPGAAVGHVVFTAARAVEWTEQGKKVVLVRLETSPEDITGMAVAEGILTARGGMTSHAAVVARGINTCCVAGCASLSVDEEAHVASIAGSSVTFREGDMISLDGTAGTVYQGSLPVVDVQVSGNFEKILSFGDEFRTMQIHANADTPADANTALGFGAQGIGLTRTEHMFFKPERVLAVREMIVAETKEARVKALAKLLPFQRNDFTGIFTAMDGKPVTVRLIDPPLHEFLPHDAAGQAELATSLGISTKEVKRKVDSLNEFNPMLGFRGCRLGIVYPEINEMQVRAIFEAALSLARKGMTPLPKIEVPLVGNVKEFMPLKQMIRRVAKETGAEGTVKYKVGVMIEVPRAALTADEFAAEVDFMSFGTNDLTQMTCGFSRDDSARFLKPYVAKGIYTDDPFQCIDQSGVGKLMNVCVSLARGAAPGIDISICGEHGGEPTSVEFCHQIGLTSVSCSPYRVPIARLAAAQAGIKYGMQRKAIPFAAMSKL